MSTSVNLFTFVRESDRKMYTTAFDAITQLELWPFIKNFTGESFMFSNDPNIMTIYNKIVSLGYTGHSGASFGCIMRTMEFIAKHSYEEFERSYTRS